MRKVDFKKTDRTRAVVLLLLLLWAGLFYLIGTDGLSPSGAAYKGELLLLNFRAAPVSGETADGGSSPRIRDGKSLYSLGLSDLWAQTQSGIRALLKQNGGRYAVLTAVFLLLNIVFWVQAQDGKKRFRVWIPIKNAGKE